MFGLEPTVVLVNRVVDDDGRPVPHIGMFDGQRVEIVDRLPVPYSVARILIHHSMFRLDPNTNLAEYKLGCPEMQLPTDVLKQSEIDQRNELLDRDKMTHGQRVKAVALNNPIRRTTPVSMDASGGDRAFPGFFTS